MERFVIDADRILLADAETVEFFWRGTGNGSSKWRFHVSHVGAQISVNRKGDRVALKLGERRGAGVSGDVEVELPVDRQADLRAFLERAGVPLL